MLQQLKNSSNLLDQTVGYLTLLSSVTLGVVSAPNLAKAAVIYQTGFENPPFPAQEWTTPVQPDGWFRLATAPGTTVAVTTNNPASGQQALQIQTSSDILSTRALKRFIPPIEGRSRVSLSVDVRLDGPDTGEGIDADLLSANIFATDNLGGFLGEILLSSNGNAYTAGNSGSYLHETPFTLGEYHRVSLISDFSNATTDFFIDGQFIGSQAFNPSATGFSGLALAPLSVQFAEANQYTIYYDNVTVETLPQAPEPSNLISFTVLGGLLLGSRMVKR